MPVPPNNGGENTGTLLDNMQSNINLVCMYTNLNYESALNLPFDMFALILRNAYIEKLMQSESGIKQLEDYKRLNTTEADIDGLKRMFGDKIKYTERS